MPRVRQAFPPDRERRAPAHHSFISVGRARLKRACPTLQENVNNNRTCQTQHQCLRFHRRGPLTRSAPAQTGRRGGLRGHRQEHGQRGRCRCRKRPSCWLRMTRRVAERIFEAARQLKRDVYGNRIVLFAPLYVGNSCTNDCLYCAFRRSNADVVRRTLERGRSAASRSRPWSKGHKRTDPRLRRASAATTPEFIAECVRHGLFGQRSGTARSAA